MNMNHEVTIKVILKYSVPLTGGLRLEASKQSDNGQSSQKFYVLGIISNLVILLSINFNVELTVINYSL